MVRSVGTWGCHAIDGTHPYGCAAQNLFLSSFILFSSLRLQLYGREDPILGFQHSTGPDLKEEVLQSATEAAAPSATLNNIDTDVSEDAGAVSVGAGAGVHTAACVEAAYSLGASGSAAEDPAAASSFYRAKAAVARCMLLALDTCEPALLERPFATASQARLVWGLG